MDQLPQKDRIWSLDLMRGSLIFTMILAHSIFFFHANTNPLLITLNGIADFVSFTGLLLISGATGYVAYIHRQHPTKKVILSILKRSSIYLLGYYLLAIWVDIVSSGFNTQSVWQVLTFQKLIPFTEFIIPFIIFGLLKIPLRSIYDRLARSGWGILTFSLIIFIIGTWANQANLWFIPPAWKAILVGQSGLFGFALLQYWSVYLIGIFVGRQFWIRQSGFSLIRKFSSLFCIGYLISIIILLIGITTNTPLETLFNRWPPSFAFIILGVSFTLSLLTLLVKARDLIKLPWTRTALLILGQNAFALFFTHTFVVYTYSSLGFPQVYSLILTIIFWLVSLFFAIYLARIIPLNYRFSLTIIDWYDHHPHSKLKTKEHYLIRQQKKLITKIANLPNIFSFKIGHKQFKLFRTRHALAGLFAVLIIATPLGLAENILIIKQVIESTSGQTNRQWVLTTNADHGLVYSLKLPDEFNLGLHIDQVEYQLDSLPPKPMQPKLLNYTSQISLDNISPGIHQLKAIITINGQQFKTQETSFNLSAPLYITWTIDWEGYDVDQRYLDSISVIADEFDIPLTQLFNPYIYLNPDINPDRAEYLTQWVINRRDKKGDEIGLHLHMFPGLVEDAGVELKLSPSWGSNLDDGYDILTTNYSQQEMVKIISRSKEWFSQKGLGEPKVYRAGAWFANVNTLKALQDSGFLVDSSGRTKYEFGTNQASGFWDLSSTTQPYHPSTTNQNSNTPSPQLKILEVPNNGADSFAFTADEMIQRFTDNYQQKPLDEPTQVTYLSHPHWLKSSRQQSMRQVFAHIQAHLYQHDTGPASYTTLSGIYRHWETQ